MKAERHENADMICAKANDMNLVVLAKCKTSDDWCWIEVEMESLSLHVGLDFFLCLPQHKEACLHWLNGGDVQDDFEGEWSNCPLLSETINTDSENSLKFSYHHMFMNEEFNFRIAPKKEKRWIAFTKDQKRVGVLTFDSEHAIKAHYGDEADSFHEIEVEV